MYVSTYVSNSIHKRPMHLQWNKQKTETDRDGVDIGNNTDMTRCWCFLPRRGRPASGRLTTNVFQLSGNRAEQHVYEHVLDQRREYEERTERHPHLHVARNSHLHAPVHTIYGYVLLSIFFWNPALTGVWRLLHCCGGQHDGHLPFWFPDFVKFIMLLLRVLFACWNKYTTVYADGVHEVAYHSYKLQWANVSNLICCCCCCTLWCIIYASQNAC